MSLPTHADVLVIDDDDRVRERLARALVDRGLAVTTAASVTEGHQAVRREHTHAILDLRMPDGSGLSLIEPLLRTAPDLQIVVLTGYGSIATAVDAVRLGAVNYLAKPADVDSILAAFETPPVEPTEHQPLSLARMEWEHIQRVLADCNGNVTHAAQKLGMHRRTLQRKLQTPPPTR